MWQVLESIARKFSMFWDERPSQNTTLSDRSVFQEKTQTNINESYESGEDSGFADDEELYCSNSDVNDTTSQTRHSESVEENDNDLVLDSDLKNQQRISLMSLLHSRALERKLNKLRAKRQLYSRREKEHVSKQSR